MPWFPVCLVATENATSFEGANGHLNYHRVPLCGVFYLEMRVYSNMGKSIFSNNRNFFCNRFHQIVGD